MRKIDLRGISQKDLQEYLNIMESKPYRVKQVLDWVYCKKIDSIDDMTNLSKNLREDLKKEFYISGLILLKEQISQDGTKKYLFELEDKQRIESVLMPDDKRLTLCVSTQVGCKFNCSFCYTAKIGFIRNLTTGEIINQIIYVSRHDKNITNVVFMGMGEPLDNYENVIKSVQIISSSSPRGLGISAGKITISTCGLIPGIKRLKNENININLAVSLNASNNITRNRLMPINKRYPLNKLLKMCCEYPSDKRKRITFEYVLIKDLNDSLEDAIHLANFLKGIRCKINLLPFNRKPDIKSLYNTPAQERVNSFHEYLISQKYSVFTRKQRGLDISASCGQLTGQM